MTTSKKPQHPDLPPNNNNITFRSIQPADAPAVARIWRSGLRQTYDSINDPAEQKMVKGFMKEYEQQAFAVEGDVGPNGCNLMGHWGDDGDSNNGCKRMLIAVNNHSDEAVLGCCGVKRGVSEGIDIEDETATDVFSIWRLSVSEDARGMGLGRLLMNEAEEWAKENGGTKMILYTGNPAASAFYQKIGYALTGAVREFEKHLV
jgi:ribosomal protein S18 acetylase RimI-like enzyme